MAEKQTDSKSPRSIFDFSSVEDLTERKSYQLPFSESYIQYAPKYHSITNRYRIGEPSSLSATKSRGSLMNLTENMSLHSQTSNLKRFSKSTPNLNTSEEENGLSSFTGYINKEIDVGDIDDTASESRKEDELFQANDGSVDVETRYEKKSITKDGNAKQVDEFLSQTRKEEDLFEPNEGSFLVETRYEKRRIIKHGTTQHVEEFLTERRKEGGLLQPNNGDTQTGYEKNILREGNAKQVDESLLEREKEEDPLQQNGGSVHSETSYEKDGILTDGNPQEIKEFLTQTRKEGDLLQPNNGDTQTVHEKRRIFGDINTKQVDELLSQTTNETDLFFEAFSELDISQIQRSSQELSEVDISQTNKEFVRGTEAQSKEICEIQKISNNTSKSSVKVGKVSTFTGQNQLHTLYNESGSSVLSIISNLETVDYSSSVTEVTSSSKIQLDRNGSDVISSAVSSSKAKVKETYRLGNVNDIEKQPFVKDHFSTLEDAEVASENKDVEVDMIELNVVNDSEGNVSNLAKQPLEKDDISTEDSNVTSEKNDIKVDMIELNVVNDSEGNANNLAKQPLEKNNLSTEDSNVTSEKNDIKVDMIELNVVKDSEGNVNNLAKQPLEKDNLSTEDSNVTSKKNDIKVDMIELNVVNDSEGNVNNLAKQPFEKDNLSTEDTNVTSKKNDIKIDMIELNVVNDSEGNVSNLAKQPFEKDNFSTEDCNVTSKKNDIKVDMIELNVVNDSEGNVSNLAKQSFEKDNFSTEDTNVTSKKNDIKVDKPELEAVNPIVIERSSRTSVQNILPESAGQPKDKHFENTPHVEIYDQEKTSTEIGDTGEITLQESQAFETSCDNTSDIEYIPNTTQSSVSSSTNEPLAGSTGTHNIPARSEMSTRNKGLMETMKGMFCMIGLKDSPRHDFYRIDHEETIRGQFSTSGILPHRMVFDLEDDGSRTRENDKTKEDSSSDLKDEKRQCQSELTIEGAIRTSSILQKEITIRESNQSPNSDGELFGVDKSSIHEISEENFTNNEALYQLEERPYQGDQVIEGEAKSSNFLEKEIAIRGSTQSPNSDGELFGVDKFSIHEISEENFTNNEALYQLEERPYQGDQVIEGQAKSSNFLEKEIAIRGSNQSPNSDGELLGVVDKSSTHEMSGENFTNNEALYQFEERQYQSDQAIQGQARSSNILEKEITIKESDQSQNSVVELNVGIDETLTHGITGETSTNNETFSQFETTRYVFQDMHLNTAPKESIEDDDKIATSAYETANQHELTPITKGIMYDPLLQKEDEGNQDTDNKRDFAETPFVSNNSLIHPEDLVASDETQNVQMRMVEGFLSEDTTTEISDKSKIKNGIDIPSDKIEYEEMEDESNQDKDNKGEPGKIPLDGNNSEGLLLSDGTHGQMTKVEGFLSEDTTAEISDKSKIKNENDISSDKIEYEEMEDEGDQDKDNKGVPRKTPLDNNNSESLLLPDGTQNGQMTVVEGLLSEDITAEISDKSKIKNGNDVSSDKIEYEQMEETLSGVEEPGQYETQDVVDGPSFVCSQQVDNVDYEANKESLLSQENIVQVLEITNEVEMGKSTFDEDSHEQEEFDESDQLEVKIEHRETEAAVVSEERTIRVFKTTSTVDEESCVFDNDVILDKEKLKTTHLNDEVEAMLEKMDELHSVQCLPDPASEETNWKISVGDNLGKDEKDELETPSRLENVDQLSSGPSPVQDDVAISDRNTLILYNEQNVGTSNLIVTTKQDAENDIPSPSIQENISELLESSKEQKLNTSYLNEELEAVLEKPDEPQTVQYLPDHSCEETSSKISVGSNLVGEGKDDLEIGSQELDTSVAMATTQHDIPCLQRTSDEGNVTEVFDSNNTTHDGEDLGSTFRKDGVEYEAVRDITSYQNSFTSLEQEDLDNSNLEVEIRSIEVEQKAASTELEQPFEDAGEKVIPTTAEIPMRNIEYQSHVTSKEITNKGSLISGGYLASNDIDNKSTSGALAVVPQSPDQISFRVEEERKGYRENFYTEVQLDGHGSNSSLLGKPFSLHLAEDLAGHHRMHGPTLTTEEKHLKTTEKVETLHDRAQNSSLFGKSGNFHLDEDLAGDHVTNDATLTSHEELVTTEVVNSYAEVIPKKWSEVIFVVPHQGKKVTISIDRPFKSASFQLSKAPLIEHFVTEHTVFVTISNMMIKVKDQESCSHVGPQNMFDSKVLTMQSYYNADSTGLIKPDYYDVISYELERESESYPEDGEVHPSQGFSSDVGPENMLGKKDLSGQRYIDRTSLSKPQRDHDVISYEFERNCESFPKDTEAKPTKEFDVGQLNVLAKEDFSGQSYIADSTSLLEPQHDHDVVSYESQRNFKSFPEEKQFPAVKSTTLTKQHDHDVISYELETKSASYLDEAESKPTQELSSGVGPQNILDNKDLSGQSYYPADNTSLIKPQSNYDVMNYELETKYESTSSEDTGDESHAEPKCTTTLGITPKNEPSTILSSLVFQRYSDEQTPHTDLQLVHSRNQWTVGTVRSSPAEHVVRSCTIYYKTLGKVNDQDNTSEDNFKWKEPKKATSITISPFTITHENEATQSIHHGLTQHINPWSSQLSPPTTPVWSTPTDFFQCDNNHTNFFTVFNGDQRHTQSSTTIYIRNRVHVSRGLSFVQLTPTSVNTISNNTDPIMENVLSEKGTVV